MTTKPAFFSQPRGLPKTSAAEYIAHVDALRAALGKKNYTQGVKWAH